MARPPVTQHLKPVTTALADANVRQTSSPYGVLTVAFSTRRTNRPIPGTAVRVAAAVDGLDTALTRSTSTPSNSTEVREAVQRMANRRAALLEKLRSMVDEVAEVYTKLLEMSAAVSSLDISMGATEDIEKVNSSLDSLRHTLADLETQADKEA